MLFMLCELMRMAVFVVLVAVVLWDDALVGASSSFILSEV
jgi:hypothetical protein